MNLQSPRNPTSIREDREKLFFFIVDYSIRLYKTRITYFKLYIYYLNIIKEFDSTLQ